MSLSQVRTYLKDRVAEVLPDWKEWSDGFNSENIPASLYGKTFQINYGDLSSESLNATAITDNFPVTLALFFKGARDPKSTIDSAMDRAHLIRRAAVNPSNAMTGINIKNVVCTGISAGPIHSSNDNAVMVTLSFNFYLMFNI